MIYAMFNDLIIPSCHMLFVLQKDWESLPVYFLFIFFGNDTLSLVIPALLTAWDASLLALISKHSAWVRFLFIFIFLRKVTAIKKNKNRNKKNDKLLTAHYPSFSSHFDPGQTGLGVFHSSARVCSCEARATDTADPRRSFLLWPIPCAKGGGSENKAGYKLTPSFY